VPHTTPLGRLNISCSEISSVTKVSGSSKVHVNFSATSQGGGDFLWQTPHSKVLEPKDIAETCAISPEEVNTLLVAAGVPAVSSSSSADASAGGAADESVTPARKIRRVSASRTPLAADNLTSAPGDQRFDH
jgi:hypothetical protein